MSIGENTVALAGQATGMEPLAVSGGAMAIGSGQSANLDAGVGARAGYTVAPAQHNNMSVNNTVNVNMAMPSIQMNMMTKGHSLFTRIIWFAFVGWWLSAIFIVLGVFFTWTFFLMPLGFWFINRIPKAQTLRERSRQFKTEFKDNAIVFTEGHRDQIPWYIRAPYAWTIGAIAGAFWLSAAWLLGIFVVTLPLSIWMIDRTPAIMTLEKN